jgi:copper(I)-binding protein
MKGRLCLLVVAALLAAGPAAAGETLHVSEAWVRYAPPTAQEHAGYFTLTNAGAVARTLVGLDSADYARVELHRTRVEGGIATMEPVARIEIAPGQVVRLAPGGLHLMLVGPKAPQALDATVDITLAFSDGALITAHAVVRRDGGAPAHQHGGALHGP